MIILKRKFSLGSEQDKFIDSLVKKKVYKDSSAVVRYGIELLRQRFQQIELEKMAIEYSLIGDLFKPAKKGLSYSGNLYVCSMWKAKAFRYKPCGTGAYASF